MIAAWAHAMTDDQIRSYLDQIPGLGAVLYPQNYRLAAEYPAIGYVPSSEQAVVAREYPFRGFICGRDEPNVLDKYSGPSGKYLTPSHSGLQFKVVNAALEDHPGWRVPGALSPVYSFWRYIFAATTFDDTYHRERGVFPVAWTPTKVRKREIARVREEYGGHQLIAPAPYIGWNRFIIPSPEWHIAFALDHPYTHTAFWSLQSGKGQEGKHGLFDRSGEITRVGRSVRDALAKSGPKAKQLDRYERPSVTYEPTDGSYEVP